ncbi:efflux RND transporter periplasmic adaptor subunit [Ruegeria hyattellae]|uniref:efflux RND transporter periplasmic adaptor subunit n=1 Tax=Ruegeria hyattellae TaxID=3233337 RepID=UPI00355BE789
MRFRQITGGNRGIPQILVLCLLALTVGCYEDKSEETTITAPKVVVAKATAEDVPLFLDLTGRTEAPNTVFIRSRVDGHVEARPFKEGADIVKGDTLFVIDQRPYATELKRLEGERDKNQASLDFAIREKERFSALASDGTVAQEQLDQKTTNAAEAQGNLDSSQGAVESARVNVDYTTVSAPISGRIGRVYQDVGNVVSANDTVLAEIVQMEPLYVYVSPSETQFLELEKYRSANPDLKVEINLIDGSVHPHSGVLDFSGPSVDPTTGTIAVRAVFPNPEKTLRPGQYANVNIQLTEQSGQVTVPSEAIAQDQAGFFVFVVGKDGKAEMRRITVGRTYEGRRIVMTGLKDAEVVIVQGQQRVRSGMLVQIKKPSDGSDGDKADG